MGGGDGGLQTPTLERDVCMQTGEEEEEKGGKKKQRNKNNNTTAVSNLKVMSLRGIVIVSPTCLHACTGVVRDGKAKVKGEVSRFSISEVICLPPA